MRDRAIWKSELISEIRTIADDAELSRLWSGADPSSISSFVEEVTHVFDDYDIDGFIRTGADSGVLNPDQFVALRSFRDRFATYIDVLGPKLLGSISHESVLRDPLWGAVTTAAREFIALLDKTECESKRSR
jgi:hypothetical protein